MGTATGFRHGWFCYTYGFAEGRRFKARIIGALTCHRNIAGVRHRRPAMPACGDKHQTTAAVAASSDQDDWPTWGEPYALYLSMLHRKKNDTCALNLTEIQSLHPTEKKFKG
jgi:hypothetical protein